jgi:hypothetical protein
MVKLLGFIGRPILAHWKTIVLASIPFALDFSRKLIRQKALQEARTKIREELRFNLMLAAGQIILLAVLYLAVRATNYSLFSRLMASTGLWFVIIYNVSHFALHTISELIQLDEYLKRYHVKFAQWWLDIGVRDILVQMDLALLIFISLAALGTRWTIGVTFELVQPWLDLAAVSNVMQVLFGKSAMFNQVALATLPVSVEILLGVLLALFIYVTNYYLLNERLIGFSNERSVILQLLFLAGFIYPITQQTDMSVYNGIVVLTAIMVSFALHLWHHLQKNREIANDQARFFLFRSMSVRDGYVESKDPQDLDNAYSSRFGLRVLGRASDRGIFDRLLGRDGWTDEERKALLSHERGHTIGGIVTIPVGTLMFYYFVVNVIKIQWTSLLLLPTFLTMVTLIAWIDELVADSWAGLHGFALQKRLWDKMPWNNWMAGTVGVSSHPPMILRYVAFRNPWVIPVVLSLIFVCWFFAL